MAASNWTWKRGWQYDQSEKIGILKDVGNLRYFLRLVADIVNQGLLQLIEILKMNSSRNVLPHKD